MSKYNKVILATACVTIGLGYTGYFVYNNYLNREKPKQVEIELTKKILQQIKHQMLIACINFTYQMQKRAGQVNLQDINTSQFLKSQLTKAYEQKQNQILSKYDLDSLSFANALKKYENQQFIKKAQKQIIDMMQRSVAGRIPDLTVSANVKSKFNNDQIGQIYYDLCQKITLLILDCLKKQKLKNPYFDSRDDQSFRMAIRSLSIYDYKVNYLSTKGFDKAWGCPNQNFFKLMEGMKTEDAQYKKKIIKIQKSYQKAIQQISANPQQITQDKIASFFAESNPLKKQEVVIDSLKQPEFFVLQQVVQHQQQQNILTSFKSEQPEQPEQQQLNKPEAVVVNYSYESNYQQPQFSEENVIKRTDSAQYIFKTEQNPKEQQENVLRKAEPKNSQNYQVLEVSDQKTESLKSAEASEQKLESLKSAEVSKQNSQILKSPKERKFLGKV